MCQNRGVEMCSLGGGKASIWGVEMCQIWGVEMCRDEVIHNHSDLYKCLPLFLNYSLTQGWGLTSTGFFGGSPSSLLQEVNTES